MPDVTIERRDGSRYLYEDGPLKLTSKTIHVFGRSYPAHRVEKIGVRREPFFLALGVAIPLALFAIGFFEYLYAYEIVILLGLASFLAAASFNVGVLHIQAGQGYGPAAVWNFRRLQRFQEAIIDHILEKIEH